MNFKSFDPVFLDSLTHEAECSSRYRQHRNIHLSHQEPCQRLFNAIGIESYIRPHRHSIIDKTECLIAVRGLVGLILFDDVGSVVDTLRFGSEKYSESNPMAVGVDLPNGVWHTVIALVPGSMLFEVKAGPFDPNQAKELASWAPEEGSPDVASYMAKLRNAVGY